MRKVVLLAVALGTFAVCLYAQDAGQMSKATSITGCLSYTRAHYILTDSSGTEHMLTGYANKLKPHVGHQVEVMGTEGTKTTATTTEGMASAPHQAPDFKVSGIKHIAETCTAPAK